MKGGLWLGRLFRYLLPSFSLLKLLLHLCKLSKFCRWWYIYWKDCLVCVAVSPASITRSMPIPSSPGIFPLFVPLSDLFISSAVVGTYPITALYVAVHLSITNPCKGLPLLYDFILISHFSIWFLYRIHLFSPYPLSHAFDFALSF